MKKDFIEEIKELYIFENKLSKAFQKVLRSFGYDDISPREFLIVENIGGREVYVNEIDRNLTNISYSLRKLFNGGYLEKLSGKRDKRKTYIRLTDKGAEMVDKIRVAAKRI
jgi:DNA-binding MarR family transcriptional regulator